VGWFEMMKYQVDRVFSREVGLNAVAELSQTNEEEPLNCYSMRHFQEKL
jgi:hypothetical protein